MTTTMERAVGARLIERLGLKVVRQDGDQGGDQQGDPDGGQEGDLR